MSGLVQLAPNASFAGDFRVVRPLAEGAMGAVYVVEQLSTKKLRALKLMQPGLVANADLRRRFEREAQVAARIKSAHVVETIGAGVDAATGIPWLAMELLEGETLAARVERTGPLDAPSIREAFGQLGHALGKAHEANIVHRDLKPENVFLAVSLHRGVPFTLKVLDFGIARVTLEARTMSSDTRGAIGTPLWWAPEQASHDGRVGPYTDVWALGLIAFWALTGRYFWRSASVEGASIPMMAMEQFIAPMLRASERAGELGLRERLPPGFDGWFATAAARDPGARFPNAGAACDALDRLFARESGIEATVAAPAEEEDLAHGATLRASSPSREIASTPPPPPPPPPRAQPQPQPPQLRAPPDAQPGAAAQLAARARPRGPSPPTPAELRAMVAAPFAAGTGAPLQSATGAGEAPEPKWRAVAFVAAGVSTAIIVAVGVLRLTQVPVSGAATTSAPSAPEPPSGGAPPPSAPTARATASSEARSPAGARSAAPRGGSGVTGTLRSNATPVAAPAAPAAAAPIAPAAPAAAAQGPPLTQGEIQQLLSNNNARIRQDCWHAVRSAAGEDPRPAYVTVQTTVDAAGSVTAASAAGGDEYPGLSACIAAHVRGFRFRPTTPTTFSLTFDLM